MNYLHIPGLKDMTVGLESQADFPHLPPKQDVRLLENLRATHLSAKGQMPMRNEILSNARLHV